ncbi:helix-turn-helix domain-containing protein [Amphritea sp.]|uniref:GlxA family transcriptional regulator n=1 Tax=Amphritea sp. TaxID=1872502 RepID=UPI0025C5E237|nr:helix-turn-helix domain-containing protein [Amphritea sp.]
MPSIPAKNIVFIVFPETKLLDLAGPLQVFNDAELASGESLYETHVASLSGGQISTDTVVSLNSKPISSLIVKEIDTLIISGGKGALSAANDVDFMNAIQPLFKSCRRAGSICTGAFILAASGLLTGKCAVTHWDSCGLLQKMYPDVQVQKNPIYLNDDSTWSSAGVTAGIDMALAMVAEDFGNESALSIARSLVTYMFRPGGQSQFSEMLQIQDTDKKGRFDSLHKFITENLTSDLRVERLADQMNMSSRNFARVYQRETGSSPAKVVERMRTERAQRLLEETNLPISEVARQVGFDDEERLRRTFIRHVCVAPMSYRERFKSVNTESMGSE